MDIHKKDLLFYSNYCEYCKGLINVLIKKNIRDCFVLVCVDKKEYKIPSFIDRVPTILTPQKEIFTDDLIQEYIETKVNSNVQYDDVAPFVFEGGMNANQYTYITSDGNGYDMACDLKKDMVHNDNFVLLGMEQRISAPKENESDGKSSKFDSSALERYMNSRKTDDELIKKTINKQI